MASEANRSDLTPHYEHWPQLVPARQQLIHVDSLGANLLGDWLRDVMDPRLRGRQN